MGDGSTAMRSSPVSVQDFTNVISGEEIRYIQLSLYHSLVLLNSSRMIAFGANTYSGNTGGALGNNDALRDSRYYPTSVTLPLSLQGKTISSIATTYFSSHALTQSGFVYSWGDVKGLGAGAQLTDGVLLPTLITTGIENKTIISIAGGGYHMLALSADNVLYAWGQGNQVCKNIFHKFIVI